MRAQIALIGDDLVHADHSPLVLRDIGRNPGPEPVGESVLAAGMGSEDVGIPGRDHGTEDSPDGLEVVFTGWPNRHRGRTIS